MRAFVPHAWGTSIGHAWGVGVPHAWGMTGLHAWGPPAGIWRAYLSIMFLFLTFRYGFHLALYLPVGGGQELHGLHLLLEILEEDEEHGHEETLVQATQDEVDEHRAYQEDDGRVARRPALFAADAGELEAVAARQVRGCHLADGPDGVARTVARGRLAAARAGEYLVQRLRRDAVLRRRLYHHAVQLVEAVEVGHVLPAIVSCQSGQHGIGRSTKI